MAVQIQYRPEDPLEPGHVSGSRAEGYLAESPLAGPKVRQDGVPAVPTTADPVTVDEELSWPTPVLPADPLPVSLEGPDAGQEALLSRAEEIALSQRLEAARAQQNVREEQRIRDRFVAANLRLVAWVAQRYRSYGLPIEDLIQEGTLGLIRAVDRFDYHKGYRFNTYALWWIRRSICRAISEQGRLIRLPAHVTEALYRVGRMRSHLHELLQRPPTRTELATALAISEAELDDLLQWAVEPVSLETPVGEKGETRLADLIPAADAQSPNAELLRGALGEALQTALADLPDRAVEILTLHYGLSGDEPCTLEEISRRLELSRERVHQIEVKALKKLRGRDRLQRLLNDTSVEILTGRANRFFAPTAAS